MAMVKLLSGDDVNTKKHAKNMRAGYEYDLVY